MLFPLLDLLRLCLLRGVGGALVRSAAATAIHRVASTLQREPHSVPAAVQLVSTRLGANWVAAAAAASAPMLTDDEAAAASAVAEAPSHAAVARVALALVVALRTPGLPAFKTTMLLVSFLLGTITLHFISVAA